MLIRRCCECGAKAQRLYDNRCEACYQELFPPIKEIKPLNIKRCNQCGRFHLGNQLYDEAGLQEVLPQFVRKQLVLNPQYQLESLSIEDFSIEGEEVQFDVVVDTTIDASRSYS